MSLKTHCLQSHKKRLGLVFYRSFRRRSVSGRRSSRMQVTADALFGIASASRLPVRIKARLSRNALLAVAGLIIIIFLPIKVLAQTFTSDSYIIEWGNFNVTSGKKSSTNYNLTDTVGQIAPGQYNSDGYIVKSGFQYIYDLNRTQFTFTIDDLEIDLGQLASGVAATDTNIITITTPSGHGYEILASENHPLMAPPSHQIPDTLCDDDLCSESQSGFWTDSATYGFGFNALGINTSGVATGIGTSSYFLTNGHFRQFADLSSPENPQVIMAEPLPVDTRSARITYKVNVAPNQTAGDYQTAVNFVAIPKY